MRFKTANAVPAVKPLTEWDELVPEKKREALRRYLPDVKGHPPAEWLQPKPKEKKPSATGAEQPWMKPAPASVQRWQEMRFGMFIHWGPVSLKGTEIGWSRGDAGARRGIRQPLQAVQPDQVQRRRSGSTSPRPPA